jgi:uncharacterized protein YodC (DUF2158 family)
MAEKAKFEVGQTVRLKSGGPLMTVSLDYATGTYQCTWFDGKKQQSGNFPQATLVEDDGEIHL